MSFDISALRLGRIVWVKIADPRGAIKRRPVMILSQTSDINEDEAIAVMAISTSYPAPPPPDHIELPWHSDRRRVQTRLGKRSAVVLNWIRMVMFDEIEELAGDVPSRLLLEILRRRPR